MRLLHQRHDHEREGAARPSRARAKPRCARRSRATSAAAARTAASSRRCCARQMKPGGRNEHIRHTAQLRPRTRRIHRRHRARLHARSGCLAGTAETAPGQPCRQQDAGRLAAHQPDGSATVFTGKVELGQGIVTALAQIAAEELDLPLGRVNMVTADTGRTPNEGVTSGSQSIENSGTALRLAAAEVRAMLIELAAPKLEMSADSLSVADGVISAANGKTITYAANLPPFGRPAPRGDRDRQAEARRPAQNRRPIDPALRHSRQGHRQGDLCAGHAPAWHGAWPRGAPAAIRRRTGLAR